MNYQLIAIHGFASERSRRALQPDEPKLLGLPQNPWVQEPGSVPARQEGYPSHLHHHLAPFG